MDELENMTEAYAIISDGKKILVSKERIKEEAHLPFAEIPLGESPKELILKEVKEHIGVEPKKSVLIDLLEEDVEIEEDKKIHLLGMIYYVDVDFNNISTFKDFELIDIKAIKNTKSVILKYTIDGFNLGRSYGMNRWGIDF